MGGGGGHSASAFYSVKLCVMINFSLHHNVLCFSFAVVLYSMYSLYAIINWFSLTKEIVMCNNNLRLKKSTHKVSRPLELIEAL